MSHGEREPATQPLTLGSLLEDCEDHDRTCIVAVLHAAAFRAVPCPLDWRSTARDLAEAEELLEDRMASDPFGWWHGADGPEAEGEVH